MVIADIVIYRELFMNDKTVNDQDKVKNNHSGSATDKDSLIPSEEKVSDSSKSHPMPSSIQQAPQSLEQLYAGAQGSEFDDTDLLDDEITCAHLEFFENGIFKKILECRYCHFPTPS